MKVICKSVLLIALCVLAFATNVHAQTTYVDGNQDTIDDGKYTILNNKYGNPNAYQGCWRWRVGDSWGWGSYFDKTDLNTFNVPAAILGWHWSTPGADTQLPAIVWNNDPVVTRANWELIGDGDRRLNVGYSLWFHDQQQQDDGLDYLDTPKVKIAICLYDEGGVTPEGTIQETVWIQGEQWQVWRRTGGDTDTITFRANRDAVNDKELQLSSFIQYVVYTKGWMTNDKILSGVEFGSEVETAEATELHVDNFYIDVNPDEVVPEPQPARETMYVSGRHLYSPTGEKVILRGVNEMFCYMPRAQRGTVMSEIAKTNANCARIVWVAYPEENPGLNGLDITVDALDEVITQCIENKMIPMVEVVDATGNDLNEISKMVDFWTRDDVVQILNKHDQWLILNIANEAGRSFEGDAKFRNVYENAITRIRNKGVKVPLVIDATDFGQHY